MKHLSTYNKLFEGKGSGNTPRNKKLWDKALRLAKGTRHGGSASVRHGGKTYEAPNDGKGFEVYPSAYANSYAAQKYKSWGGDWKVGESCSADANSPKPEYKPEDEPGMIEEDLRDWHKQEWVRIDTQGNIAGPCGSMPKGKSMQRCLPRAKAESLTKAERKATVAKKVAGDKKGKQFVANTDKARVTK